MATIIQQAVKGKRKAMMQLYEANKQKVYYISLLLLGNEAEAAEAASFAFKNVWGGITAHAIASEREFTHLAIRRAADYCKKKICKQNPKAFRVPPNRNFLLGGDSASVSEGTDVSSALPAALPALQRFILVLHSVGGYLPEQLASLFKFDLKTIGLALDAEPACVERALLGCGENQWTYQACVEAIRNGENRVKIPASVEEQAASAIDKIAAPIEKKKKKRFAMIGACTVVCVLLVGIAVLAARNSGSSTTGGETDVVTNNDTMTSVISSPVIDLDETLTYYADIEIAEYGTITVQLDQEAAPVTTANFVNLAQNGFYDGLTFHRIIEGFMMQGGDPNGDGSGGSEDCIVGEFSENGYENSLSHTRGAISMAHADDYDSASSQFFIVQEDSTYLDGQYAVFGYVTEGLEVVDAVCEAAEPTDNNGTIEAEAQPVITSITIRTE